MNIYFQKCKKEDFINYYLLKCDKKNIIWTGHKNKPNKNKLKLWFNKQLKRTDRIIFLVKTKEYSNAALGYLYIDIIEQDSYEKIVDVGYGVNSKYTKRGIGTNIIKFAIDYVTINLPFIDIITAWVVYNNIGSIKVFLKNKFIKTKEIKKEFFEGFNKEILMEKYIYNIKR